MCEGDRNNPNFDRYNERNEQTGRDLYAKKHEAYGYVDAGEAPYDLPVLGNSQFSVKKKSLGDLRYDERYFGRSFEDLDFIHRFYHKCIPFYTCAIMTEGSYAMFHIQHAYTPGFNYDR